MKRYVIAFGAMILLLGGLFFFNIGSGSVKMTGSEIADILLRRFGKPERYLWRGYCKNKSD